MGGIDHSKHFLYDANLNATATVMNVIITAPSRVVRWGYRPNANASTTLVLQCNRKVPGSAEQASFYGEIKGKSSHTAERLIVRDVSTKQPAAQTFLQAGEMVSVKVKTANGAALTGTLFLELAEWGFNPASTHVVTETSDT